MIRITKIFTFETAHVLYNYDGKGLEQQGHKVIYCNYQPTCENMLYDIANKIKKNLPSQVQLAYLKLHETENSYGEWLAEENL